MSYMCLRSIDFVHVGFHKTATTWWQMSGFPQIDGIEMPLGFGSVNSEFVNEFVECDELLFLSNASEMKGRNWVNQLRSKPQNINWGISEENFTGHFWTGRGAKERADRIFRYMPQAKVLMVVREQDAMLGSLYDNYCKHGGSLSIGRLLQDELFEGKLVYSKLCYDSLVNYYKERIEDSKFLCLPYEMMLTDPEIFFKTISEFLEVEFSVLSGKPINRSISRKLLGINRALNKFGFSSASSRGILNKIELTGFSRGVSGRLGRAEAEIQDLWSLSNRRLSEILDFDFQRYGYKTK